MALRNIPNPNVVGCVVLVQQRGGVMFQRLMHPLIELSFYSAVFWNMGDTQRSLQLLLHVSLHLC